MRIVMETWAMVMLALASVYGLVRFIQDVRDSLNTRATAVPNKDYYTRRRQSTPNVHPQDY